MQGRIKHQRIALQIATQSSAFTRAEPPLCPLCERVIPRTQIDAHHLIPKSRGGTETVLLHRVCHRQIHALLSEVELERSYASVGALRTHPELSRFVQWIRSRRAECFPGTRTSGRRRGK